ncbi:MAG: hypothetical protein HYY78_06975 [Betaproteobacteria bacterium]|nr:hypothetical protein [Betaproteobacteria bacterium]
MGTGTRAYASVVRSRSGFRRRTPGMWTHPAAGTVNKTAIRGVCFRREFWMDLTDPRLVFSLFTIVAASDVFGMQLVLRGLLEPAIALWLFALVVWTVPGYRFDFGTEASLNLAHDQELLRLFREANFREYSPHAPLCRGLFQ